ncbi:MAG: glycosyltransferase family 39 protein, partial [Bdellovibrionales bacterium]|nr:glycosyltransferase family 39 protein [Bdellovibrionales bacterium]
VIRLWGISYSPPVTDERLWISRSPRTIDAFKRDPSHFSTHLAHPGVPPAVSMGIGVKLSQKYNQFFGLEPTSQWYVSSLKACRIAVAVVSSFLVPLVFLLLIPFIGSQSALFVSGLICFDPQIVGYARMAHLDSIMTLFVVAAVGTYALSVARDSALLRLVAGVLWGFAILTKPTAGVLAIAFLLYRAFRWFLMRQERANGVCSLISWSDIWAVVTGCVLFAMLYTRMWYHESDYLLRLRIRSHFADFAYQLGLTLQRHYFWLSLVGVLIGFGVYLSWHSKLKRHVLNLSFLSCGTLLSLAAFPQVYENFIRFWTWAGGLSHEQKVAYASLKRVPPPPGGYWATLYASVPSLFIPFLVIGIISFAYSLYKKRVSEKTAFIFLCLVGSILWLLMLNVSPKQSWRYLLPVVPLLYVVLGVGVFDLVRGFFASKNLNSRYLWSFITILIGLQLVNTALWYPDYTLFRSRISGGMPSELTSGRSLANAARFEVTEFLVQKEREAQRPIYVSLGGDATVQEMGIDEWFPSEHRKVAFGQFPRQLVDYYLTYHPLRPGYVLPEPVLFQYTVQDVPLVSVSAAKPLDYFDSTNLPLPRGITDRGLIAGKDTAGNVSSALFRLPPGKYSLRVRLEGLEKPNLDLSSSDHALEISFFGTCNQTVTRGEIEYRHVNHFEYQCDIPRDHVVHALAYWPGKVSIKLLELSFKRQ